MSRNTLSCIVALVVLVGFSSAWTDVLYGPITNHGIGINGATVYARDEDSNQYEEVFTFWYYYIACEDVPGCQTLVVPPNHYYKAKAYKADVGVSGWTPFYWLDTNATEHWFNEPLDLIDLPKR